MPISQGIDPNVVTQRESLLSLSVNRVQVFTGLTGGGSLNFDGIDGSNITANTVFRAVVGTAVYDYIATTGTHVESSPDFINPDSGGGFYWTLLATNGGVGTGDVLGPGTSTARAVSVFVNTDGVTITDTGVTIDASDNVIVPGDLDASAFTADSGSIGGYNIGYREIPQNSKSAAYTTVLLDGAKHLLHPTADNNARTFTIDSNANVVFPIGTAISFINQINTLTIAITSDTMTLFAGSGTGTTGSRTLAAGGVATALKVGTTSWIIWGVGLT